MSGFQEASEAMWEENVGATTGPVTVARAAPTAGASEGIATPGAAERDGIAPPHASARASIDGVPRQTLGGAGGGSSGKTLSNILCCLCGRSIQPNGANMCGACLKEQVDVTDGIPKKGLVMIQCRRCLRWLTRKDNWNSFEPESAPFLALVLKKIPGIAKQEVVDAKWVWTEPHSKRLKVKVAVRKEVLNKVMLQQDATVEFVVHNRQCSTCNKEFTNQTWKTVVQLRQKAGHKRTMLLLEQQILRADAHRKCISVESVRGGMDVYFGAKHDAAEFVTFIGSVAPIRSRESTKLVSTDNHSNIRNTQHTIAVDIPALCRDDLVILPRGAGNRLQGTLCLVHRVTSVLQFVSPFSGETAEMPADKFWRSAPAEPLLTAASLVEFVVLDCEPFGVSPRGGRGEENIKGKTALWDVVVVLASDVGNEEHTFSVTTSLGRSDGGGRALEAGDALLGYDLRDKNFNEVLVRDLSRELPDIVLVKRAPPPKASHSKKKKRYKLRSLEGEARNGEINNEALSGAGRRGAGSGRADHSQDDEAHEVAALIEELSLDEELREELGVVFDDVETQDEVPEHHKQSSRAARKSKRQQQQQQLES